MGLRIGWLTLDTHDVPKLAAFWQEALGAKRIYEEDGEIVLEKDAWKLLIYKVDGEKKVKNRLHLDLIPDDQDAEVARMLALGATRVDIGQTGEESWVVMADPEGNEFCILTPREDA